MYQKTIILLVFALLFLTPAQSYQCFNPASKEKVFSNEAYKTAYIKSPYTVYYNRTAAYGYAYMWWSGRNPNYQDYTSSGGDCANFASQCLITGGLSLHAGTDGNGYGVYPDTDRPSTSSNGTIPYCDYMHQHLTNYQPTDVLFVVEGVNDTIPSWMEIGDMVIFGNTTDKWKHAMMVVWKGSNDLGLAGHTTDTWNTSFYTVLGSASFSNAYFYHIRDCGYNTTFVFKVFTGTLNVRVGCGKNTLNQFYQDIGDLHSGEMYVAYETKIDADGNLWYHFWYDDRPAWCAANYSGNVYTRAVNQDYLEIVVGTCLNVRTGPGTSYTDIGDVYSGMRFYPIARVDNAGTIWVKYYWEGREAWSSENYTLISGIKKNITRSNLGFYPYWMGSSYTTLDHNYLTHIPWFSIDLNSDGTVATYNNWPSGWTALVEQARENGTKIMVTATLFGSSAINTLLSSATYRTNAVTNIVNAVKNGNADGAMIDFETPPSGSGTNLTLFMQELKNSLQTENLDYQSAICLSPYPWSSQVWQDSNLFPQLNNYVNYYFLMGYDYFYGGSSTSGAVGALFWDNNIDAYNAINLYLSWGTPQSKFIYGIPYFGYDWPVDAAQYNQRKATTTASGTARTYDAAVSKQTEYSATLQWDTTSQSPWFWYYNGTNYRQIWFDNATSLKYKYQLVNSLDLAGMGIWALAYDSSTTVLWGAINEKLGMLNLSIKYPSPGSLVGGTVNATIYGLGGITQLWYKNPYEESWQRCGEDIDLHKSYVAKFYLHWNTNNLQPGWYTLQLRGNNSYGYVSYWNYTYYVRRNVALEGNAYGSSDAYRMIDDEDYVDSGSGYASNDLNKSLYINLPCNFTIRAFKIHLWDGDGRYYQYKIEVSQNNSTWNEVVNRTTGEWRGWQWVSFEEGSVKARYIKITGTYNSANQWYHIIEFQVFVYEEFMIHTLYKGWNFFTFSLLPDGELYASNLMDLIGPNCTSIARWGTPQSRFVCHIVNTGISNFKIHPGVGYLVYMISNTTFTLEGGLIDNITMGFTTGWNSMGFFNETKTTANKIVANISNASHLARWNTTTQNFEIYDKLLGTNNFTVERGYGYLVYVTGESTYINQ